MEMHELPVWLQELWKIDPSLARLAERDLFPEEKEIEIQIRKDVNSALPRIHVDVHLSVFRDKLVNGKISRDYSIEEFDEYLLKNFNIIGDHL